MSPRALPAATDRRAGVRGALLHTLPGRAIVIGLAIKLLVDTIGAASGGVSPFLAVVDTVATLAAAIGVGVFLFRLVVLAKHRLLWRVRRKLILSYIFIGFVPAMLLVAFFVLCGLLLFFNVSSYLVQGEIRSLADQTRFLATSAALEIQRGAGRDVAGILRQKLATLEPTFPGLSMAMVPVDRPCASAAAGPPSVAPVSTTGIIVGAWAHSEPPS